MTDAKKIAPIFVDDRQLQQLATQAQAAVKDLYERVQLAEAGLSVPRVMPLDRDTDLCWPLNEPPGSPSFGNFGARRQPSDRLLPLAGCAPSLGGLLNDCCAILYGADATRGASGAVGFAGSTPLTGSLSAWVRLGDPGSATTRVVGGYFNAAGTQATMQLFVSSAGVPTFSVQTTAGTRSLSGIVSQRLYPGTWHFLAGAYDGTSVGLSLDGMDLYSGSLGAIAPLQWGLTSPSWRLGLAGSSTSWMGAISDLRMHSVPRSGAWAHEAWKRGLGLWEGS